MNVDTTGACPDRPHVLVVDDDPTMRVLAEEALGTAGFFVTTAADGEAALALLGAFTPDIILLDVLMPGIDGNTLCRQLRNAPGTREIPVCIMTGLDDMDSIQRAFESGATDFTIKPLNWYIAAQRLRYILRASRIAHDLSVANTRLQQEIGEHERTAAALRESEERLRLALVAASQGLYDLNLQTGETVINPEYARMLGYEPGELEETNAKFRARLHDEDRRGVHRAFTEHLSGAKTEYRAEFRQRAKSGEWKWCLSVGRVVAWDKQGRPLRMLGTHTDITERKELEQAERDQRQLAEALRDSAAALNGTLELEDVLDRILESIGRIAAFDAVYLVMLEGAEARVVRQRGAAGQEEGQEARTPPKDHCRLADLPLLKTLLASGDACVIADTLADPLCEAGYSLAGWTRSCFGIPLEIRGRVVGAIVLVSAQPGFFSVDSEPQLRAFASQASVAIENAQLFKQVHSLSITDGLTGLNNRRHFFDLAKVEFERTQRYGRPLSVAMVDIDRFKDLNDRWGHLAGDEVLREVARCIRDTVRAIDLVARYGGEEFVVLMPETDRAEALRVAGRICRAVAESSVEVGATAVSTTVSVGVAEIDAACVSLEDVLRCADQAMYAAKAAGRNRVSAYQAPGV